MNATSHTVVQRPEKIIAQKGKHQVGAISLWHRGEKVIGVYPVSERCFYVPPMLIYPTKRMKESLSRRVHPGTVFRCQDKSWMDYEVFCQLKCHFISTVKPIPQEKLLIISDGHSSYALSLAAIEISCKHAVVMLWLLSHSTHRMQPLIAQFSSHWARTWHQWS
jgi:hypothetical protein